MIHALLVICTAPNPRSPSIIWSGGSPLFTLPLAGLTITSLVKLSSPFIFSMSSSLSVTTVSAYIETRPVKAGVHTKSCLLTVVKWQFIWMNVNIQNNAKHLQGHTIFNFISPFWTFSTFRPLAMTDRIKNHERDIAPARAQNSAISEHDIETGHVPVKDQVRFIDHNFP